MSDSRHAHTTPGHCHPEGSGSDPRDLGLTSSSRLRDSWSTRCASARRYRSPRNDRCSGAFVRRGFFWADVAIGLAVIGLIAVLLVSAVGGQNKAAARLSDARAATRIAEDALTALQTGGSAPADPEANVQVRPAQAPDVTRMEWAEVTVVYRGRTTTLSGLVPTQGGRP